MWYASGWEWIDSNGDGVAECYYFDTRGYMLAGTTTPDGYTVNADGAWVHDDTVQTKKVEPIAQSQVQGDLPRTDVYDSHGISMAALDIKSHTRQENAKYGEVKVTDNNGYDMTVYYSNGLDAPGYCTNNQQRTGTPEPADYYKDRPVKAPDNCRHCKPDLQPKPHSGGCPNPASSPNNHLQNCRQGLPCSKSGRGFPLSQTADISRRYWAGKPSRFRGAHRQKIPRTPCC